MTWSVASFPEETQGSIMVANADGSEPERLTDFDEKHLYWYGYAPDGKTLVVTRGELSRDAVLVENFLPNP